MEKGLALVLAHSRCAVGALAALLITLSVEPAVGASAKGIESTSSVKRNRAIYDTYILGPGDSLFIELLDIPELSGVFSIGPDGTLYLPRLRALYAEGLTVEELRYFLTEQFKAYVKEPRVFVNPVSYRPVRVYVGGEISRPGYYSLSGAQVLQDNLRIQESTSLDLGGDAISTGKPNREDITRIPGTATPGYSWPTLFDALRAAQGVTPYSNLKEVEVVRKQPLSEGGGKIRTSVDFLRLVTNGDEVVNIRLFDGDVVRVKRSDNVMRDQLLAASRTNLSPDFIEIYISGRIKEPGRKGLPQGSTLNQAIASAGGPKLLRGKIEFLRFSPDGETDRRTFNYNPSAESGDYRNPVLMSGDVVRINESIFSATVDVLNEVTGPAVGIYSIYSLFKP